MTRGNVRVRFAPSPTGYIHIGNARTALFNYLHARGTQGAFILRIEDTDTERSRRKYEEALIEDLRWLGLDWDEGPYIGGPFAPYRQSERIEIYRRYLEELICEDKAYRCYCTPSELEARRKEALAAGRPVVYDGRCARLSAAERARFEAEGRPFTYRYRLPHEKIVIDDVVRGRVVFDTSLDGDVIIWKSDDLPTFHFAVTIDDALMEISLVLRGEGHLPNAPIQVLLARDLGFRVPGFAHMSQTVAPGGAKISKRRGGMALRDFRESGHLPEALANYIALLGWSPRRSDEVFTVAEAVSLFDVTQLTKASASFDKDKFSFVCRRHMQAADPARLAGLAGPFLERSGLEVPDAPYLRRLLDIARHRAEKCADFPGLLRPYLAEPVLGEEAMGILREQGALEVLEVLAKRLQAAAGTGEDALRTAFEETSERTGRKGRGLYMPVRVALTGSVKGAEIMEIVPVLGMERVIRRLRAAIAAVAIG